MREYYLVSPNGRAAQREGGREMRLPVYRACQPIPCSRCEETIADADLFTRPQGEPVCSECLPCMYEWIDADGERAVEWSQGWVEPTDAARTPSEITG